MKRAVSVFIMDVTNSSKFNSGSELTSFLREWTTLLEELNSYIGLKVKYRMGDEIICLVEGYFSAFVLAEYMIFNWRYKKNMPYFGVSYGEIDENFENIDIEIWNNPMIKQARLASELIKNEKTRSQLIYIRDKNGIEEKNVDTFNFYLKIQSILINEQTEKQREIFSLFSLLRTQKKVSEYLNRTPSTISGHIKSGKGELILEIFDRIVTELISKQVLDLNEVKEQVTNSYEAFKEVLIQSIMKKQIYE